MKNHENNDINLTIINSKTLREVAQLIKEMDNKIINLLEYSSDDFMNLNSHLKHYHAKVTEIEVNIDLIFKEISDQNNHAQFAKIKELFHHIFDTWKQHVSPSYLASLKQLLNLLRNQDVPLNNLRQNLKSLKLVYTNPCFDGDELNHSSGLAKNTVNQIDQMFTEIESHQQYTEEIRQRGESIISHDTPGQLTNLENLFRAFIFEFENMFSQSKKSLETLNVYKDKNKSHVSEIVTNLQYQDIIHQKIEHIQEIHKEIYNDLCDITKNSEQDLNDNPDFLNKIKDIAGLQAAQLILTNEEYQNAIKIINTNLLSLQENMEYLAGICDHQHDTTSVCSINQVFNNIKSIFNYLQSIHDPIQEFVEFDDISKRFQSFIHITETITSVVDRNIIETEKVDAVYNQVNKVSKNIKKDLEEYKKVFTRINNEWANLQTDITQYTVHIFNEHFKNLKNNVGSGFHLFNDMNHTVQEKIDEIRNNYRQTSKEIRTSGNQAKYYRYFENIIEEIIDHLNTINLKLGKGEQTHEDKLKNLEYLKKKYTTASEHRIHDNLLMNNINADVDVWSCDENDDDNLELF